MRWVRCVGFRLGRFHVAPLVRGDGEPRDHILLTRARHSLAASTIALYRLPSMVASDRQKERAHRDREYGFLRRTKVRLISNIVKGAATLYDRSTFVQGAV